ncbi:MAG: hypothetical protein B7X86_08520 [Sphingobacteriales bacterium 17-39-43]|uniref:hypothetical protein n=1 Tax=Daejeonella sp. TaxID=2805397 RepID=UPI000BD2763B|nr:hypothetical protein [Daejeonella sp.]MCF8453887.1 hypothetical protein [Pedobacter sp.]OYZ33401.1 MAG: hypothetical protein B7Y24_03535 [Sphingobacteriales bacterium 16-39-50]OZA24444.1 MAG: hypothetical protein B7X86_08520 [Sphingobacteriales bacterium 17-39-43]HQT22417.1 hypothetical protein [Daejeonella sp.]HQT56742.1 hypothetical protein [Daejeonella sp.]
MKYSLILLLLLAPFSGFTQDFKGVWLGYMDTDLQHIRTLNVNYILHVKEQDNNIVNGKAYIYRDNPLRAEGILDFIGVINKGNLRINELKILHSKIPSDTARFLCIKDLKLNLSKEEGIDNLTGTFTGAGENSLPCYPGNVYLQRFTDANKQNIPQNYLTNILLDARDPNVFLQTKLARPIVIEITENVVRLEIKDYLREDGDIISVYHNRRPFIRNQLIVNKPTNHTLRLNRNQELHEIILYAENLGKIPPNTSNLRIYDGVKEHQVLIRSTKEVSAVVYLRYAPEPKSPPQ